MRALFFQEFIDFKNILQKGESLMEKTIKYLENGEYHYATVRSVGDLAQLKTDSKETLVEAINELWNGGGNADPSKAPKPEGYDQLVEDVADAVKNQQEISQQWMEWQKEDAQLTEERKQAYLQAMKEMQESIDKAKADAAALDDKTAKLDEQITKTFSDLDTNIQNMHEQLQKEADRMNQELQDTKGALSTLRTDLQNAQLDNGKIHDELTNINGKFEHKVWQTDLDPLKAQIDRAETSVQQTKDELLGKASREDLDTVTNAVSKLDTQLKETAKGVEISVKKDELGGDVAEALTNKTNILLGTRRFTTNNWTQRDHVEMCSDPWKGFLVAKQNSPIEGIQQAYDVKAGTTYTFSLFAKMDNLDDSNKPQITLAQNNLDTSLDTKIDVWRKDIDDITSDFKRYDLTFTPSEDCTIYPHVISNSNNPIFVCGYQLEIGKELTPWEPNQEDVGDYVEKSEAQFNVYNDKIQALTEKQRQHGDTQEQLRTEVTQTAEGVKQVSESLKNTNGDITKLRGDLERTADHMKSEYESYTNKAVGQISDSTLNLIRNSSFQNKDEDFAQWQNVSSKANVRQDENGLRWVELTQSGLATDNPQGITSNYFNVKQGKVTIAVDIKSGDKASLDNESVLFLELYNDAKKRVDFRFVTLSELSLSNSLLGDHKVHRGLYRLGIDRNDAKYMTVKAHLMRNGDLYFTNFSARLSSIDDGAYEPNPDDINQQILKQNTKIEQNAKEVAIKANSVDVTRDIKSAVDGIQVGGANLIKNGDANLSTVVPWENTLLQSHTFYYNGTRKMFNLHTSAKTELTSGSNWFPVKAGQQYTLYFNGFMSTNVSSYDVYILGKAADKDGGWTDSFNIIGAERLSPSKNCIITRTFTVPDFWNNYVAYIRFDNNGSTDGQDAVFFFNEVSLKEGNVNSGYSPAAEDTSDEIKSAKDAAIQVASDQINIHVNELTTSFDDKLNKRVNEVETASEKFTSDGIEQTVTKITNVKNDVDRLGDKVNGIQVGTSNLLHNSDTFDGWIRGASTNISGKYLNGSVAILGGAGVNGGQITANLDGPNDNALLTWSVYAKADIAGDKFHTELWGGGGSTDQPLTTDWKLYKFSGRRNASHPDFYLWGIIGNKGNIYVSLPVAVIGNTIGSWTPNSEDINKKIDTQVLDSANINDMKTQGHYFVKSLTGNPLAGWVYVDVMGIDGRLRQDVYQDDGSKHMYRRLFGNDWSGWEQGAYLSDVNNVKKEVTASVKNLGDRVTTEVNSVTTKIKQNNGGGVNLLKRSGFRNATLEELKKSWSITQYAWVNNKRSIVIDFKNGNGTVADITQDVELEPNTDYVLSLHLIFAQMSPGKSFGFQTYLVEKDANGNSVIPYKDNGQMMANSDMRSANTRIIHTSDTTHKGTLYLRALPGTQVEFNDVKLERGNIATPWSDSPEDLAEFIEETNTKWDVANGQIQGKVTATDVNNILNGKGYATQSWAQTMFTMKSDSITLQAVRDNITNGIQNQVNSIDNRVTNITAGGTNLLKGTSMNPVAGDAPATDWKDMDSIYNTIAPLSEDQYVLSFEARGDIDNQRILTFLYHGGLGGNDIVKSSVTSQGRKYSNVDGGSEFYLTTQWARYWVIYNVSPENSRKQVIVGRRWANESSGKVYVRKVQLERGNVATDWRPAPEDQGSGVNVLRGTADFSWPTGIGTNGTVNLGYEKFDATTIQLHVWGNNGGIYTKWGEAFPDGQIQVGEQYVFSFDIKGNGTFSSVKNESESLNIASGVPVTNTYQRVKVVGTIKSLDKAFIIYFQGDYDVRIKNVKIERGSKATPWTPHPFDDKDKGVNLLKSTAYWNPNDWNHISDGHWYDDNWTDNLGHKAYGRSNAAWDGLGQTVYVTPGVYTWSAQIYLNGLDSNDSVYPYMGDSQYNGTVQVQDIRKPMLGVNDQNKWINYSATFYVKNAGNLCVRPELNRDHGTIHVGSQKLEHGMVATPWSPSPLDDKNATITLDSADVNNMKTQGHYFVRNLANNPISGWVYVDVTGNNNDRLKQEVYQDNGYEHRSRRWTGSGWTEWTTDVNNKNVISQINITPDQIKIASNKIVIDGNTDIHGTLRVPDVKLAGRNGNVDLSGDGINITKTNGAGINIANNGIQLTANTNGQNEVEGVLTTAWSMNNKNQNGIGLVITPEQTLGRPYGGDILTIGSMVAPGTIHAAMVFDATGINPDYKKGFNWFAPHTLNGDGGVLRFPGAQDDLMLYPGNMPGSRQSEYSQPTLRLVHGNSQSSAGVQFQWYDIVPFGRITSSMSYVSAVGTDDDGGITVSWYSYGAWYNGRKAPSIVYRGSDGNRGNGGIVFYPYGEVCFWQGDFHSNLRWSGMKNTD